MVYRADHDDWSFPKGHCNADESPEKTFWEGYKNNNRLFIKGQIKF